MVQGSLIENTSWKVESFTEPGKFYTVTKNGEEYTCTCPSFQNRHIECKHIKRLKADIDLSFGAKPKKKKIESKGEYEMRTKSGIPLDIAVSGLQKEIRRGNTENAVFLVQDMVLAGFIRYAYRRLMIIAAEDCGADPIPTMAVHACYENDRISSQDFKNGKGNEGVLITQAVVSLCKSKKNRINDDLWCYLLKIRKDGEKPEVKDYFIDEHTAEGREKGRGDDFWYRESSKLENKAGKNPYEEKLKKIDGFEE